MIYLDYAASSKIHPKALEAMNNCWNSWANPSSMHKLGKTNKYLLESCRESLKNIFNVQNNAELYFTSSASEANNLVLNSTNLPILISPFEHPSIASFPNIETFDIKTLEEKLKEKQYLVCFSLIHNETGMLIATKKIISLIKKYNSKLLIDASQAKTIDFTDLNCDYLTISSHKIGGPIGISCLISKTLLKPLIYGGGQEFNIRSSTEALPLIVGFTTAANELKHQKYDHFYTKIEQKLSKKYIFNTFSDAFFEKHIVCLLTYDIPGTEVFAYMDMNNIAVSYGSACSSGTLDKLKILNIDHSIPSKNAIRISFGFNTKMEEIDQFCSVFNKFIY